MSQCDVFSVMSQDIGDLSWQKRGRSTSGTSLGKQKTRGIPRVSSLILRAETEGFELRLMSSASIHLDLSQSASRGKTRK